MTLLIKQAFDAADGKAVSDETSEDRLFRLSGEIRGFLDALEQSGVQGRFVQDGIVTRWTGVFNKSSGKFGQPEKRAFLVAEAEIFPDADKSWKANPGNKIKITVDGETIIDDSDYSKVSAAVAQALTDRLTTGERRQFMKWCREHPAELFVR